MPVRKRIAEDIRDAVPAHFAKEARRLDRLLAELDGAATPGHVHQLRVCTRRMRTILWLLKGKPGHAGRRRTLNRSLRKLARRLGSLRELDVALVAAPKGRIALLRRLRRSEGVAVARQLTPENRRRIAARARAVARDLERARHLHLRASLARLRAQLAAWEEAPDFTPEGLHKLRICVKKIRYTLEAVGRPVAGLRPFQDALGRVQDLRNMKRIKRIRQIPQLVSRRDELEALREVKKRLSPALRFSRVELDQLIHY